MATLHNGRRPALIPSIESLSPEEVRDVLCNRIGRPLVPPPDSCLAVSAPQGQIDAQPTRRLHNFREPPFEGISKLDSAQRPPRPGFERERTASSSTLRRGEIDKAVRWIQGEENARGGDSNPETIKTCSGPKRKHAVYARDEQRRYSNKLWEDIPHMSEIESDHDFPTSAKDIFGLKGQRSLFADTGRSSKTGPAVPSSHSKAPSLYAISPRDTSASSPPFWSL